MIAASQGVTASMPISQDGRCALQPAAKGATTDEAATVRPRPLASPGYLALTDFSYTDLLGTQRRGAHSHRSYPQGPAIVWPLQAAVQRLIVAMVSQPRLKQCSPCVQPDTHELSPLIAAHLVPSLSPYDATYLRQMIAKHGDPIIDNCKNCGGAWGAWQTTCNWSMRSSADVWNTMQCANPACRHTWEVCY
jgi:hypothetical protein